MSEALTNDLAWEILQYEMNQLTHDETVALFQRLVDTGLAWSLQGHYGRTATALLASGEITSPTPPHTTGAP